MLGLLILLLVITGCRPESTASTTNSFANIQSNPDGVRDGGTGMEGSGGLASNELRVRVQVPASSAAEGDHQGLVNARNYSLQVHRVGTGLTLLETLAPQQKRDSDTTLLRFPDRTSVPVDINLVIEARVNGETYWSPLAADNRQVRVNPFSDYLVRRELANLSANDIIELNRCQQTLCPLELIWPSVVSQVQLFNITLPPGSSQTSAQAALSQRGDFTGFVQRAINLLRLSPASINSFAPDSTEAEAFTFNSVFFGVDLNQLRGDGGNSGLWVARSGVRATRSNDDGTGFNNPNLSLASIRLELFDLNITTLGSTIPFQSRGLQQDFGSPAQRPVNEHASVPRSTFSRDARFLSGTRPMYQTVRQQQGMTLGRTMDPFLLDARMVGGEQSPEVLLAGFFHGGSAVALGENSRGELVRQQVQEDLNSAALKINLRQNSSDEEFSLSRLHDSYNLMGFRLRLGSGDMPVLMEAELGHWSIGSGSNLVPGTHSSDDVMLLQRSTTNEVSFSNAQRNISIDIFNMSQIRDDSDPGQFRGHLFLNGSDRDYGIRDQVGPNGAASPNGDWLAFTPVSNDGSYALQLAVKPPDNLPDLVGSYQLQGFSLAMDDEDNRLRAFQGACLEIGDPNIAELHYQGVEVHHNLANRQVRRARNLPSSRLTGSISGPDSQGRLRITLPTGEDTPDLVLEGFTAPDGEALILRKHHGQSLGPVFALKESLERPCGAGN
ncbi:MAG: hypothetical protein EA349_06480 [Halomonadaceae bacterium]|nr:MAG: hypothetical protein EA349_06480 [Halomonadaceae bacterium]